MKGTNANYEIPFSRAIPKLIHQTYSTPKLPDQLSDNVCRLRDLNPEWRYYFWDDISICDFIHDYYGNEILNLYSRINANYGAARADVFRYFLMYQFGGVYLDIKSAADLPLNDVINYYDSFILSQWRNAPGERYERWGLHPEIDYIPRGEYQQWHIIAAPGHPFLKAVIGRVLFNIKRYRYDKVGYGRLGVLRLTGPIAYTKSIYPILSKYPHRKVQNETELGFRYSIFERDGRHYHGQIFGKHYAIEKKPIVKRAFPYNMVNWFFYHKRRCSSTAPRAYFRRLFRRFFVSSTSPN
jgi:hypothetical protein